MDGKIEQCVYIKFCVELSKPATETLKQQKMLKKFENSSTKTVSQTIHEFANTTEISYGVCQETLTENLKMHCTAPSS
jgi:hypothetical protein